MATIPWIGIGLLAVGIVGLLLKMRRQTRMLSTSETQLQQATGAFGASMSLVTGMQKKLRETTKEDVVDQVFGFGGVVAGGIPLLPMVTEAGRQLYRQYEKRKKLEAMDQEVQVIQLRWEPLNVLDHPARVQLAQDIGWKFTRKALKVGKKQDRWLALYCMEAAKETSMLFGRSELLDYTLDDLKRAFDRVHHDLSSIGAAKLKADKVAAFGAALSDTKDARSFYHVALAAYGVLEANPLRVLWHTGVLVFPTSRVKSAAIVYIAARLAFYLYSGEDQTHEEVSRTGGSIPSTQSVN